MGEMDMSLRNMFQRSQDTGASVENLHPRTNPADSQAYRAMLPGTHAALLERVDLNAIEQLPAAQRKQELKLTVEHVLSAENVMLNDAERKALVRDVLHEMLGFGPLETLMADPTVTDILVNGHDRVLVERNGVLEDTDVRFHDNAHLMKIIEKIVSGAGRRIDESSPMVDARLPDGSRVNVIIPPLAVDGPVMSIRRFSVTPLTMADFIDFQSLAEPMAGLLEAAVRARLNILISGGTGGGKTTLLNILSGYVGTAERVVTIEDTAELRLQQPHVVRLESRPPNIEGKGEVSQRALMKNALRMRPDRIIVGEVRGEEAIDMLQAMNTGHEGSLATVHANTPRDALMRVENMVSLAAAGLTSKAIRQQIASAISLVIQIARMPDGRRKLVSVQEVTGMEGETIAMQEIFSFRQTGVAPDGKVLGHFGATGIRPRFCERLQVRGIPLAEGMFNPDRLYILNA
jgi:pilus assembly protein CpaF